MSQVAQDIDDLMAEAERLMNNPVVPRNDEKQKVLLDALRRNPGSIPIFIEQVKVKIKERGGTP